MGRVREKYQQSRHRDMGRQEPSKRALVGHHFQVPLCRRLGITLDLLTPPALEGTILRLSWWRGSTGCGVTSRMLCNRLDLALLLWKLLLQSRRCRLCRSGVLILTSFVPSPGLSLSCLNTSDCVDQRWCRRERWRQRCSWLAVSCWERRRGRLGRVARERWMGGRGQSSTVPINSQRLLGRGN